MYLSSQSVKASGPVVSLVCEIFCLVTVFYRQKSVCQIVCHTSEDVNDSYPIKIDSICVYLYCVDEVLKTVPNMFRTLALRFTLYTQ